MHRSVSLKVNFECFLKRFYDFFLMILIDGMHLMVGDILMATVARVRCSDSFTTEHAAYITTRHTTTRPTTCVLLIVLHY